MSADLSISALRGRRRRRLSVNGSRALFKAIARGADIVAIAVSGGLAALWRFRDGPVPDAAISSLFIGCLTAPYILSAYKLYEIDRLPQFGFQIRRVLAGWVTTFALAMVTMFAFKTSNELSRLWVGAWLLIGGGALVSLRLAARYCFTRTDALLTIRRHIACVGTGPSLRRLVDALEAADLTVYVAAVLDLDGTGISNWPRSATMLRDSHELEAHVRDRNIDEVVLAAAVHRGETFERIVAAMRHLPVNVSWAPDPASEWLPVRGIGQIGPLPIVRLLERPIDGWRYIIKGIEDRVLAGLILFLISPLLAIIALAIKLDSPGPVLYRQLRYGFSREPIMMFKFRTMRAEVCDPPDATQVWQVTKGDPRVTRLGRILRRTSLDELPQLLNVLKGEMSLVGPRPHAVAHDQYYASIIDKYLSRQRVKPGMTGWAQVNGLRGEIKFNNDMRRRIEYDLYYIENWSLWFDLRIMTQTIFSIKTFKNAF